MFVRFIQRLVVRVCHHCVLIEAVIATVRFQHQSVWKCGASRLVESTEDERYPEFLLWQVRGVKTPLLQRADGVVYIFIEVPFQYTIPKTVHVGQELICRPQASLTLGSACQLNNFSLPLIVFLIDELVYVVKCSQLSPEPNLP